MTHMSFVDKQDILVTGSDNALKFWRKNEDELILSDMLEFKWNNLTCLQLGRNSVHCTSIYSNTISIWDVNFDQLNLSGDGKIVPVPS